jgi:hypothetical protein
VRERTGCCTGSGVWSDAINGLPQLRVASSSFFEECQNESEWWSWSLVLEDQSLNAMAMQLRAHSL